MMEMKRTVNELIDKRIHPISGFKYNSREDKNKENRLKAKRDKYNKKDYL